MKTGYRETLAIQFGEVTIKEKPAPDICLKRHMESIPSLEQREPDFEKPGEKLTKPRGSKLPKDPGALHQALKNRVVAIMSLLIN